MKFHTVSSVKIEQNLDSFLFMKRIYPTFPHNYRSANIKYGWVTSEMLLPYSTLPKDYDVTVSSIKWNNRWRMFRSGLF